MNSSSLLTCSGAGTQQNNVAIVVEKDGRTDGFVVFAQVLDEASIYSIGVHFAHQRKGLGCICCWNLRC